MTKPLIRKQGRRWHVHIEQDGAARCSELCCSFPVWREAFEWALVMIVCHGNSSVDGSSRGSDDHQRSV